ncbi:hypothetical protein A2856_01975 [Candidatus Uhrbacteria bacterium RIFCSPHIGHO2_01_FULL_63_20]|uniref:Transcription elongation factor GreA n=1 Tax=Candidatus Uhrbacteria bacterium RIFCSPHIGHO2_01_FULL_63_20 TaxID=1802385 RepID=A0A1F7TKX4_9BACT|nr:MAG: hypothetical protein A2856_01975 [Candidatus Uhrbacteria bacterium RIFCSPHIGHO2_01_FULL_63_20]
MARLTSELERLEKIERAAAAAEVRRAGEMGDFSENAGYQAAKAHLRRVNARILSLQERLKTAIPIPSGASDGTVHIGSVVEVEIAGRVTTYEILGSQESDPSRGRISYLSPLGAALMGRATGEEIIAPSGAARIVSVR